MLSGYHSRIWMHISYLVHDQYQILHLWIEICEHFLYEHELELLRVRIDININGEIIIDLKIDVG